MEPNLLFYVAFSFLLVHEMDAVKQKEWRMLPGFSKLNKKTAQQLFVTLHIPVYISLLYALIFEESNRSTLIIILDGFFIIHLGLHLLFIKHQMNSFKTIFSKMYIAVPAILGGLDLLYFP